MLTFNLMSPLGKIRAGLGAMGFKAPLPGARRAAVSLPCQGMPLPRMR